MSIAGKICNEVRIAAKAVGKMEEHFHGKVTYRLVKKLCASTSNNLYNFLLRG